MRGALYLALRYLAHNRIKSAVLVGSIALIGFLPSGLRVLVGQSERQLTARADATPLLVGAKGSPLELVLNSLYFASDVPATMRYGEAERIGDSGLALAIPLYVRFRAQRDPIVATTLDYFPFRGLRVARGRQMTRLGDCVLGARVAAERGLGPGDHVLSSPENVFDLAGTYPLRMRVTGVLAPRDNADDDAVFVDIKTAWVIEGLAHGHAEPKGGEVLKREEGNVVANASVVQYNEVTDENIASFHFHGDPADFPITAVLVVPRDARSGTLLMGRYQDPEERNQIVRPRGVLDELLATVLTVQRYVVAALAVVGLATAATAVLVFLLSFRLRRREIETMRKIGGGRGRIAAVLVAEVCGVVLASALVAGVLTWLTALWGAEAVRGFLR